MDSFDEFKSNILKLHEPKTYKITNSLGVYDAYKYIRSNKWLNLPRAVTEKEFYAIIKAVNLKLIKYFMMGYNINLPNRMGKLELHKYKATIKLEEGKIKTNLKVDWNKTLKLWHDNEECRLNKTLIRIQTKYLFKIKYNKSKALYNNKTFVSFIPCRSLKKSLKDSIDNGLDTIEYMKYTRADNYGD